MNYRSALRSSSFLKESTLSSLRQTSVKSISTTCTTNARQAGRYKITRDRSKPLTFEQSFKPDRIGSDKSWTSFNSANLWEGQRRGDTLVEDLMIRKIVNGFWPGCVMGDVVIKRRANVVFLAFFISLKLRPEKVYFLTGFTEQILSYLLKCPVKLEIQTGYSQKSMIVKYI